MKSRSVLALGAGAMGARAASTLSTFPEVASVTVADRDVQAAQRVSLDCGGKGTAVAVDVTDRASLVKLMSGHDCIMNCVGPFFRFGVPVLEAAIEARVDYLDICDDPQPTREMLDMDGRAREAGITCVIGMGASPGINNLLGACVRRRLDEVDMLTAAWNIEEKTQDALVYSAAIVHWLEQCSGTILECVDGRLENVSPLQDLEIDYPGRGRRTLYTVGHPEPVSFHYTWPEARRTCCAMVMPSAWISLFRDYQRIIDRGEKTLDQAAHAFADQVASPSWLDALLTSLSRLLDGPRLPVFFVLGQGRRGGRKRTVAASVTSTPPDMPGMTSIPLALGTLLHLRNAAPGRGVVAPEAAFDPDAFFAMLAPYCSMPKPVTASQLVEYAEEG